MRFHLDEREPQEEEEQHWRYSKPLWLEFSYFQNCKKLSWTLCLGWLWNLMLSYVLSIMVLFPYPNFFSEAVDARLVWNWIEHLLRESWSRSNENCRSCLWNTERLILSGPPVTAQHFTSLSSFVTSYNYYLSYDISDRVVSQTLRDIENSDYIYFSHRDWRPFYHRLQFWKSRKTGRVICLFDRTSWQSVRESCCRIGNRGLL